MSSVQRRILEWSEGRPLWQRDLLRRVASNPVTESDRLEVQAMLLGAAGAPAPVPIELEDLPADAGEHGDVRLDQLGDLQNVNAVAPDQRLRFVSGLNVVYGGNGSGKSGYTRVLRRLCRSPISGEVLRDVFRPETAGESQTATVVVRTAGQRETIKADLSRRPPRSLSAIGVFDSGCAEFYLSRECTIDWLPASLHLLRRLAEAQDEIARSLKAEAVEVRDAAAPLPDVAEGTSPFAALTELDAETEPEALARLADLDDAERAELALLERGIEVGTHTRSELRRAAAARAKAAHELIAELSAVDALLDDARLTMLDDAIRRKADAEAAEELLATRLSRGALDGTGSPRWLALWRAAETFASTHGHSFPLQAGQPCPLCQHEADAATAERMARFREFVLGEQRRAALAASEEIDTWLGDLPDPGGLEARMAIRLEALPPGPALTAAKAAVEAAVAAVGAVIRRAAGQDAPLRALGMDLSSLQSIAEEGDLEVRRLDELDDQDAQRAALARLRELRSRRTLAEAMPNVRARIAALVRANALDEAARALSTNAITRLLGQLSEEVITDGLRDGLSRELTGLHPVVENVRVRPRSSKGEYTVKLELSAARTALGEVLSEGEQRGLALAFFLAESATRGDSSALVFDDPVSSLDHDRRRWVAKRLVGESSRRQVIVFTHDLAFVSLLNDAARDAGSESKLRGQSLERLGGRVGVVFDDDLPAVSPARRRDKLRRQLLHMARLEREDPPGYRQEVERWLLGLRRGYESVIEHFLLRGVVRRMDLKIQQNYLRKVSPDPELVDRVLTGIRHTSQEAHLDPPELMRPPLTTAELQELLDEYESVCVAADPKKDSEGPAVLPAQTQLKVLPPEGDVA